MIQLSISHSQTARKTDPSIIRGFRNTTDKMAVFSKTVVRHNDRVEHCQILSTFGRTTPIVTLGISQDVQTVDNWPFADNQKFIWTSFVGDSSNFPQDKYICLILSQMLPGKFTKNIVGSMGSQISLVALDEMEILGLDEVNELRMLVLAGCDKTFQKSDFDYLLPFVDEITIDNKLWKGNSVSPKIISHV